LDVRKRDDLLNYDIYIKNGKISTNYNLTDFLKMVKDYNYGELVINSIDHDGTMRGYDENLLSLVSKKVNIPITILGGASSFDEFSQINKKHGPIGLGVGSLFVFKGKFRAVLINYPSREEKMKILNSDN